MIGYVISFFNLSNGMFLEVISHGSIGNTLFNTLAGIIVVNLLKVIPALVFENGPVNIYEPYNYTKNISVISLSFSNTILLPQLRLIMASGELSLGSGRSLNVFSSKYEENIYKFLQLLAVST